MSEHDVSGIVEQYGGEPSTLIAILQDVQQEYRHLPQDALTQIADNLSIPLSRAYSLATFFKAFSLEPKGKYAVNVCLGTACHVRGGPRILEKLERDLGVKAGETTADMNFSLDEVHCLGCCGLAPVVTVNEDLYGKLNLTKLPRILKKYLPKSE